MHAHVACVDVRHGVGGFGGLGVDVMPQVFLALIQFPPLVPNLLLALFGLVDVSALWRWLRFLMVGIARPGVCLALNQMLETKH